MREFHPLTTVFPLMEGKAFTELVEDIKTHGLRHPIIVDRQGRIIDGRNRARACHQLGDADPVHTVWDEEGSLTAFIISVNLHRRHLTVKERGLIAAKLVTSHQGRPEKNIPNGMLSIPDAAALLKVSPHTVQRARVILQQADPDLLASVQAGDVSLEQAVTSINKKKPGHHARTREGQKERVARIRDLAREGHTSRQMATIMGIKEDTIKLILKKNRIDCPGDRVAGRTRRMTAAGLMDNLVFAAEHLLSDVNLINFSELDPVQLEGWVKELKTAHRALGVFIRQLTGRKDQHGTSTEDSGPEDSTGSQDTSGPHQSDAGATGTGYAKGVQ